eukprot:scaffold63847_cov15-Tisochrysis_lutea.AAC.2
MSYLRPALYITYQLHDLGKLVRIVCLWDYQKGVLLARASAQAEIMAATFAADGSIASAGKEHLKDGGSKSA